MHVVSGASHGCFVNSVSSKYLLKKYTELVL
jgi:hypothetical protein